MRADTAKGWCSALRRHLRALDRRRRQSRAQPAALHRARARAGARAGNAAHTQLEAVCSRGGADAGETAAEIEEKEATEKRALRLSSRSGFDARRARFVNWSDARKSSFRGSAVAERVDQRLFRRSFAEYRACRWRRGLDRWRERRHYQRGHRRRRSDQWRGRRQRGRGKRRNHRDPRFRRLGGLEPTDHPRRRLDHRRQRVRLRLRHRRPHAQLLRRHRESRSRGYLRLPGRQGPGELHGSSRFRERRRTISTSLVMPTRTTRKA